MADICLLHLSVLPWQTFEPSFVKILKKCGIYGADTQMLLTDRHTDGQSDGHTGGRADGRTKGVPTIPSRFALGD